MDKKAYLFFYNDEVGTRNNVKNVIDEMSTVTTWRYDMPNMFYIISKEPAEEISKEFASLNGDKGRYIFLEFTENSQGLLYEKSWNLLNNKRHDRDDE